MVLFDENVVFVVFTVMSHCGILCAVHNRTSSSYGSSDVLRVHGEVAVDGRLIPHIVMVADFDAGSSCTGGMIHLAWTLTAAHCITDLVSSKNVKVVGGFDDMMQYTGSGSLAQESPAKSMTKHPKYDSTVGGFYDFLLIELEKPFKESDVLKVIPLSTDPWPKDQYNVDCVAGGWGRRAKNIQKKLRMAKAKGRHGPEGCSTKCFSKKTAQKLICLDKKGAICQGDSGGILSCGGKAVGVAHAFFVPEHCGVFDHPKHAECEETISVFMSVCDGLPWISEKVPGIPKAPYKCTSTFGVAGSPKAQRISILTIVAPIILVRQ